MHYMELMKERGEAFPVLYQEAILLLRGRTEKIREAFRSFPISQEVQNRFLQFMKVARSMPPAALNNSLVIPIIITLNLSPTLNDNNTWIIQRKGKDRPKFCDRISNNTSSHYSRIFRLLVLASGRNYERHERTYVPASYFSGL